jgi:hypothetical protein
MSDGNEIELGAVERQDTYIAPELIGTGLLQKMVLLNYQLVPHQTSLYKNNPKGF